MQRPKENFYAQTGRTESQLHFLIAPVDTADVPRDPKYARWRGRLKKAKTSESLLEILNLARERDEVDGSVIGASMQKCGHGRWWSALLEVEKLQLENSVHLSIVERSIFLNAIASCLKDTGLSEEALVARQDEALQKGRRTWQSMPDASNEVEFNCALGSAWNLCASAGSEAACDWATILHEWSCSQPHAKNIVTYASFLTLLESRGYQERVDELLDKMVQQEMLSLNEVLLGSLVNAAGGAFDWQRAERLWQMFVTEHGVRPNVICYTALAKIHTLSGRPRAALESLNGMHKAGVGATDAQAALCYLQVFLICCHSEPTEPSLARLMESLTWGESTMQAGTRQIQKDWEHLAALAERLCRDPSSLQFHQLLVQENARKSKMKDWQNYPAGSKYLRDVAEKRNLIRDPFFLALFRLALRTLTLWVAI